ncbi:MAG TPA: ArsB/NhaD family transporter [Candidatus Cloacimonadota bacterium]|nr:ArsB/NhaD family transporter [Candidatus Cloacimonadota bacterium]HPT70934.1 ArsB/NhaD family transporter [Candidatus Cloacimonadota bacterium]
MTPTMFVSIGIFLIAYFFISSEIINKIIASLCGALLMIAVGIMSEKTAFGHYVDWDVLFLLIGMMLIIGLAKQTGMFQYVAIKTAKIAKGEPVKIMLFMFVVTAVISAFLPNVTTIMIVAPVTILIATELKISPVPFMISQAVASNIGGTATLIGDPPNVMIGSATGYDFMSFIYNLTPVVIIITLVSLPLSYLMFASKMKVTEESKRKIMAFNEENAITDRGLMYKSFIVMGLLLTSFLFQGILHLEAATLAMLAATLLMIISKYHNVEKLLTEDIEWGTIFFFIGLFIIVGGLVETGVIDKLSVLFMNSTHGNMTIASIAIVWMSGILSAIVDNIPYVATMIPLIKNMGAQIALMHPGMTPDQIKVMIEPLWWSLSLGACLGGNGTLVGASANVVSVGIANKAGHKVTFWEFTKYGIIYTVVSLIISTIYVYFRYLT